MAEDTDMGMTPPEESGNRTFLIAAIILGVIFVIALISIFALYFLTQGGQPAQPPPQNLTATVQAQARGTQTAAFQATQTKQAQAQQTAAITATFTRTQTLTKSPTITPSPVVFATILAVTPTFTPNTTGTGAGTATTPTTGTVSPAKTATRTAVATGLPQTGFGDTTGFLGLITLAGACLMIIILARQLRLNRAKH
jgi:cytoskeletal protein RodZ